MPLNILTHPHPNLRKKSRPLKNEEILSDRFKKFIQDLGETMLKNDGIGLAAPQVDNPIRAIVININEKPMAFINPRITKKSWRKKIAEEGCLSVPGVYKPIQRYSGVTIKYLDLNGQEKKLKAKDLLARVLQHEIDHLDGILFIDKIKNF